MHAATVQPELKGAVARERKRRERARSTVTVSAVAGRCNRRSFTFKEDKGTVGKLSTRHRSTRFMFEGPKEKGWRPERMANIVKSHLPGKIALARCAREIYLLLSSLLAEAP